MKSIITFLVTFVIFMSSCSVQKRHYMRGFYVSKKSKTEAKIRNVESIQKEPLVLEEVLVNQKTNETENDEYPLMASSSIVHFDTKKLIEIKEEDCGDLLTLRNGDEIKVKVIELTTTEIKYKRCDNIDGPLHAISKNEVFSVKYSNGTKAIMPQVLDTNNSKTIHWGTITGLGCSLLAILLSYLVGIIVVAAIGVLAVVFSILGYRAVKKYPDKYKGYSLALASVILSGIVLLVISLIPIFFLR